jgi:hypothetical protein
VSGSQSRPDLTLVPASRRTASELLKQRSLYYQAKAREAETVREGERFADQAVTLYEVAVALKEHEASA